MSIFEHDKTLFFNIDTEIIHDDQTEKSIFFVPSSQDHHVESEETDFFNIVSGALDISPDQNFQEIHLRTINRYQSVCQKHLNMLDNKGNDIKVTNDQYLLRAERNTWRLLFELCKGNQDVLKDQQDALLVEPSTEYEELHILGLKDLHLRHFKIVLNWLEAIAGEIVTYSDAHRTMRSRTISSLSQYSHQYSGLVKHVDPDAASRENLKIHQDDGADEMELYRCVWNCIRCGNYDKAIEMCVNAGHSWLAASISGGQACGAHETVEPHDDQTQCHLIRWGNPNRFLWKSMCWKLSESKVEEGDRLQIYERAIYAALSNNTERLLQSPVCQTWEDHCWILFKSEVDNREDSTLQARALHLVNKTRHLSGTIASKYIGHSLREEVDVSSIFHRIASSANKLIRMHSVEFYHRVQAQLIESSFCDIITIIWDIVCGENNIAKNRWKLQLTEDLRADRLSRHELRFAAHLALFFFSCKEDFEHDHAYMLLKAYIRRLVQIGRIELVPYYVAQLPENGCVQVYAEVLLAVDEEARRECVQRAKSFISSSVLSAITKLAVENSILTQGGQGLRTIELLCVNPQERAEAIIQSNVLIRGFIAQDDQSSACFLLEKVLPLNSLEIIESMEQTVPRQVMEIALRELLMWKVYLKSQARYNAWRECHGRWDTREEWAFDEERQCLGKISMVFTDAVKSILDVLKFEGGWLRGGDSVHFASVEFSELRKKILPRLLFDMHAVYFNTAVTIGSMRYHDEKERASDLLVKSLELCSLAASDCFHIYSAMSQDDSRHLLELISQSAMEIMKIHNNIDDLF